MLVEHRGAQDFAGRQTAEAYSDADPAARGIAARIYAARLALTEYEATGAGVTRAMTMLGRLYELLPEPTDIEKQRAVEMMRNGGGR